MDDVFFSQERHLGIITLNRPQALNALTLPMLLAIQEQLIAWMADETVHAVILKAIPGKAFCAGGDVRWLYETGRKNDPAQMEFFWHEYRLNHYLHQLKKPFIALMDGITMGGGVGISLHGSHPVASENFVFAMPETAIGFFPDIGASYLLSRCPDEYGVYLGLTGNRVAATDAKALGLVKGVVLAAQFDAFVSQLKEMDLSNHPYERVSQCLNQYALPEEDSLTLKQRTSVRGIFHQDSVEAIMEALEKSPSDWHQEIFNTLKKKSPLSLKVTLTQIRKAKLMTMAECVKMDYCLVQHFMHNHDFYEGVRALLIDKDKSPDWKPQTLEDVSDFMVSQYFKCSDNKLKLAKV